MIRFGDKNKQRLKHSALTHLVVFSSCVFFYNLGDAIICYIAPVAIEAKVNNTFLMGIVVGGSSIIGLLLDFILGSVVKNLSFSRYALIGLILAVAVPVLIIFGGSSIAVLLLAMLIWGVLFEFMSFAQSGFVRDRLNHQYHDIGWAYMNNFSNIGQLLGPTIAVYLSFIHPKFPEHSMLVAEIIALVIFVSYLVFFPKNNNRVTIQTDEVPAPRLMDNIKICSVLIKRMWPILMFYGALIMVDACFWTIGSVMVDQHKEEFPAIGLLFIIYLLPSLIFAPLGLQVAKVLGKKRTAFIAGIVTGLMYFLGGLSGSLGLFLIFVAIGSLCREIAHSEIRGATEDYCSRLDDKASPLVGMIMATNSIGYIIGPMIAGLSGQYLGYQRGIGVFGFGLAVSAIVGLVVVPRKLKIPQTEIHNLLAVE